MKKLKVKKTPFISLVTVILIVISLILLTKLVFVKGEKTSYLKSNNYTIALYDENLNKVADVSRGSSVSVSNKTLSKDSTKYYRVTYDKKKYYVMKDNLTNEVADSVEETKVYVRTPVTVYKNNTDNQILGYLKKGTELEVVDHDKLLDNGIVNMYKVKYNDTEGYVYGKYVTNNLEDANKNYNENKVYDTHKDRTFSMELYGGTPANLDYYPYEKANFEDNVIPTNTKTLYLNSSSKVLDNIDEYIKVAKEASINAFVVDIKDGSLAYISDVAKKYSKTSYESTSRTKEEYKKIIDKLKDNGFYVIGRIVAFNDYLYAVDNLDDCILDGSGTNTKWVSPYSRKAWEYNVDLAIESIKWFGFNEIQFDYVRFSESSYSWSKHGYNFKNTYGEEKAQAVQNFLLYATDEIHKYNTYISVDVFGECANTYVTAYGQYWPAISNIVDVISAMPYPDHFNKYEYGFTEPVWTIPYKLLTKWGKSASDRQKEIPTPAKARTWIQVYDAIHDPKIEYTNELVQQELQALYDSGLKDGFITWHGNSSLEKYTKLAESFKKEY